MKTDWKHTRLSGLIERVPAGPDNPFAMAIERDELYVGLYCPEKEDHQQPHERDECHFVVEGSGEFICKGERVSVEPGDFLFVPAGMARRFENFSERLRTWVLFYGPQAVNQGGA